MQHPVTNEYEESRMQINETLKAIREIELATFCFGQMLMLALMGHLMV